MDILIKDRISIYQYPSHNHSFADNVTKALKKKDGKVTLVGFGTFSKAHRKARKGRNPQTGEPIKIKASNTVKFKPGKALKDSI
ncbi:MAG: HU family DNA-binding protein [Deltaproteobacteria bacterium]|nr:HU family DNA-binding protein [Deltaproteobacteria bacterium]MBW2075614.1 HU family DNA-binding protein [Deltaproteobacteria bacterium]